MVMFFSSIDSHSDCARNKIPLQFISFSCSILERASRLIYSLIFRACLTSTSQRENCSTTDARHAPLILKRCYVTPVSRLRIGLRFNISPISEGRSQAPGRVARLRHIITRRVSCYVSASVRRLPFHLLHSICFDGVICEQV